MRSITSERCRPPTEIRRQPRAIRTRASGAATPTRVEVRSAGSAPADQVKPAAVEAMPEVGIDISNQTPKLLEHETAESSDVTVTMGRGGACPVSPGKRYEDWKTLPARASRPYGPSRD